MESILIFGQIPYLLGVFLLVQLWIFVFNHLCPFLDNIPQLNFLNPRKSKLKFGIQQVPISEFLAWQGSDTPDDKVCDISEYEDEKGLEISLASLADSKEILLNLYRAVPWRLTSRLWGQFNEMELPLGLRVPLLGLYCWMFDCNIKEALNEDLKTYKNLSDFFRREIKPEVRPVDISAGLVSPCDGKILHYGKVENCKVEQVKGVTYSLKNFLGPNSWNDPDSEIDEQKSDKCLLEISDEEYHEKLGIQEGNCLYNCIIYLAPGDYHRFHSPTDWSAVHRRHFPGELFSVNPGVARWIQGLFNFNERVVVTGSWPHGYFSMTAVGATNVGSIKLFCDKELRTNNDEEFSEGTFYDKRLEKGGEPVQMEKGNCIGEFNLGSTIVLVFEAPKNFKFMVEPGEKIRLGERLGSI